MRIKYSRRFHFIIAPLLPPPASRGRFYGIILLLALPLLLFISTISAYHSPYPAFLRARAEGKQTTLLDRSGNPLFISYATRWNTQQVVALHDVPEQMQRAFILSEDKRFYTHDGVDILAKAGVLWQAVRHQRALRGASTITEQVVRMLRPRPRTLWAKWMEAVEAIALERATTKADILEFYLNQVPYAANRRGIVQAAHYYFNRAISTLTLKEMLALVILVRSPSAFDLYHHAISLEGAITRLAHKLGIDSSLIARMKEESFTLASSSLSTDARHFVRYVRHHTPTPSHANALVTSLDSSMQRMVQSLLQQQLHALAHKKVRHAAALVVDNHTREILAWVSLGAECEATNYRAAACEIDMVTEPRQPASALKPFLYALALEKGWQAATILDDSPYNEAVGRGIHHFHNYSRVHYGKVRVREALGNSLNIPALHAINYVTPRAYLQRLHAIGFEHLQQDINRYDIGLALGNGEVTLLELTRAYVMLARRGEYAPLTALLHQPQAQTAPSTPFSSEVTSLISNILSDPWARQLEFGRSSLLNMPVQTAVKTGTSTDYRDAWAMGYNEDYTVGIWMGNADYTPMDGVTGATSSAFLLRSIFTELTRHHPTTPLYLSPTLMQHTLCMDKEKTPATHPACAKTADYFIENNVHKQEVITKQKKPISTVKIIRPNRGLEIALDPRIPLEKQAFEMQLSGLQAGQKLRWKIDDTLFPATDSARFLWTPTGGAHQVQAIVEEAGKPNKPTATIPFMVK